MHKILIIEDDINSVKTLAKILLLDGFEVMTAIDACQGFDLALEKKPELVIMDLMLPAGGGLSVLKKIHASEQISNMPVVVITGMKDEGYKENILNEGVKAFLTKPYDLEELKTIIRNIFSNKEVSQISRSS